MQLQTLPAGPRGDRPGPLRRPTRLTNAFSKRVENLVVALWPFFSHYNFVRVHGSLRTSPAIPASVTAHLWTIEELLNAETSV
jgi:hypothetical protein